MSKGQPLLTVIVVGVPEIASNVARDRLRSPQITTARSGKPQARSGRPQAARRDTTGVEAGTHKDSLFLQALFSSALAQLLGNNRFLICLYLFVFLLDVCLFFQIFRPRKLSLKSAIQIQAGIFSYETRPSSALNKNGMTSCVQKRRKCTKKRNNGALWRPRLRSKDAHKNK